jgi:hypothetical protein
MRSFIACTLQYHWGDQFQRMRWVGHAVRMDEMRNAYKNLVEKPEGKRPIGTPWRRREDNIKMELREIVWGVDVD